jgi:hypothetical protein
MKKLDEEKSKHAGLAQQQNGLVLLLLHSLRTLLRLVKKKAHLCC